MYLGGFLGCEGGVEGGTLLDVGVDDIDGELDAALPCPDPVDCVDLNDRSNLLFGAALLSSLLRGLQGGARVSTDLSRFPAGTPPVMTGWKFGWRQMSINLNILVTLLWKNHGACSTIIAPDL